MGKNLNMEVVRKAKDINGLNKDIMHNKLASPSDGLMELNQQLSLKLKYEKAKVEQCNQNLEEKQNEISILKDQLENSKQPVSEISEKERQLNNEFLKCDQCHRDIEARLSQQLASPSDDLKQLNQQLSLQLIDEKEKRKAKQNEISSLKDQLAKEKENSTKQSLEFSEQERQVKNEFLKVDQF